MEKNRYQKLVKNHTPKENICMNAIISFLMGGFIGILAEALIHFYMNEFAISKEMSVAFMSVSFIFVSCFFTCLGFFDKWVHFFKSGLFIPITGFAHAMQSAALEYKKEGFITGIGASMFKLTGSVIVFGICSAFFFALIRIIFLGVGM